MPWLEQCAYSCCVLMVGASYYQHFMYHNTLINYFLMACPKIKKSKRHICVHIFAK